MTEPPTLTDMPSVTASWSDQGCVLELTGRMTRQLLDHARDLVYAQTRPATRLTVRVADAEPTRELVAMLVAVRRNLARVGSTLHIEDPRHVMPLRSDADGRLIIVQR